MKSTADVVIIQRLEEADWNDTRVGHVIEACAEIVRSLGMSYCRASMEISSYRIAFEGWKTKPENDGPNPFHKERVEP